MARPRRHLRRHAPRRAQRAKFGQAPRPVAPDTQSPLRLACEQAMALAVRLQRAHYDILSITAVGWARVTAARVIDRPFSHGDIQ